MFRVILLMMPFSLWAQIHLHDSFQDGDFKSNPPWWGDTALFKVVDEKLVLDDSISSTSFLGLQSSISEQAQWYWHCQMDFNPSASNYLDLILLSDNASSSQNYNGYYLRLGGTKDQICLWRRDGIQDTLLACSPASILDSAQLNLKIKVERDSAFNWALSIDSMGTYPIIFKVHDDTYRLAKAAGWRCYYTKTRASSFAMDSVSIYGWPAQDFEAPTLLKSEFIKGKLWLTFDEVLSQLDSAKVNLEPLQVDYQGAVIGLELRKGLPLNDSFRLDLYGIHDLYGNQGDTSLFLIQTRGYWGDLRISEIMYDPSPPVGSSLLGFPEAEYLEVYNTSAHRLNLKGWQLIIGDDYFSLDSGHIDPGAYLIFSDEDQSAFWPKRYKPFYLPWSRYQLSNQGTFVGLVSSEGQWVDSIYYKTYWQDDLKRDGGWSLECRNLDASCRKSSNWSSAEDEQGGTPGGANSLEGTLLDSIGPRILSWAFRRDDFLVIDFDEELHSDSLHFWIEPSWPAETLWVQGNQFFLFFKDPIPAGEAFQLKWDSPFYDCVGNKSQTDQINFSLAAPVAIGQVRISEVLFNPKSGGVDFVELYNQGTWPVDLQELRLLSWDYENNVTGSPLILSMESRYLAPDSVIALCEDLEALGQYHQINAENCMQVAALPSMPDEGAALQLQTSTLETIDRVRFSSESHSPFFGEVEGISLNRNFWQGDALRDYHWESSTRADHYASPGEIRRTAYQKIAGNWQATPEYFTPNGDRDNDVVDLVYNFENAGVWAQVYIFDRHGVLQRELESGSVLGREGALRWKGENSSGALCPSGIYMAVIRYIKPNGEEGSDACSLTLIRD